MEDKAAALDQKENILFEVMTFSEACIHINKSPSYFNNLAATGKIKENRDYRKAGGCKLILKSVVEAWRDTRPI